MLKLIKKSSFDKFKKRNNKDVEIEEKVQEKIINVKQTTDTSTEPCPISPEKK